MASESHRTSGRMVWSVIFLLLTLMDPTVGLASSSQRRSQISSITSLSPLHRMDRTVLLATTPSEEGEAEVKFSREVGDAITNLDQQGDGETTPEENQSAATSTVNERLMAELKAAENKERFGPRSSAGRKIGLVDGYGRPRKTDEEIEAAIAAARDLNGVNPAVALSGSFFAMGAAAVLWYGTNQLGIFFATHPVDSDVYFVIRTSQVVRNIAIGLISLASGFFGVVGFGIFLLGVRVSYGVLTGELDPTPIKKVQQDKTNMPNVWDLMLNKKPNRSGSRGGGDDDNPFGI